MGTSGNMSMTAVALASAAGQIPYATGANALAMLAIGAANTVLTSSGSAPQWSSSLSLGGTLGVAGLTTLTGDGERLRLTHTTATSQVWQRIQNGTVTSLIGVESSTGGNVLAGSSAYAAVWGSTTAHSVQIGTNNTVRVTIDSSGNVGINGTPKAWGSSYRALDFASGQGAVMVGNAAGLSTYVLNNTYYDGSWRNTANGATLTYEQAAGVHIWYSNASPGAAGTAYTPTERWRINASGHFLTGSDNAYDIGASGATRPRTGYFASGVTLGNTGTGTGIINAVDIQMLFRINGTDMLFLTGAGINPNVDSTSAGTGIDLGSSGKHFRDCYVWRAAFNGSLRDSKRNATLIDRGAALRVARATKIRRYQYKPGGPDDVNADRWHIGFYADDAHPWLSDDHVHASAATTASLALAAISGEADAREAEIARLEREIAGLRAELRNRRN